MSISISQFESTRAFTFSNKKVKVSSTQILELLEERPWQNVNDLQAAFYGMHIYPSINSLQVHLRRLYGQGCVSRQKVGGTYSYCLTEKGYLRLQRVREKRQEEETRINNEKLDRELIDILSSHALDMRIDMESVFAALIARERWNLPIDLKPIQKTDDRSPFSYLTKTLASIHKDLPSFFMAKGFLSRQQTGPNCENCSRKLFILHQMTEDENAELSVLMKPGDSEISSLKEKIAKLTADNGRLKREKDDANRRAEKAEAFAKIQSSLVKIANENIKIATKQTTLLTDLCLKKQNPSFETQIAKLIISKLSEDMHVDELNQSLANWF